MFTNRSIVSWIVNSLGIAHMNAVVEFARRWLLSATIAMSVLVTGAASAEILAPDKLINRLSSEVLAKIKADPKIRAGDYQRVAILVDQTIMPHVNFKRMTALAVGRGWRQASPKQRDALAIEFRALLLRTYSGALSQLRDQRVKMKRLRAAPDDDEVIVRSNIVGRGDPIQLNYRLEKAIDGWKIFDINVLGVWLIETYRSQFKQIVNARGIKGLIKTLHDKNEQFAKAEAKRG